MQRIRFILGQLLADLQTHWLAVTSIAREAPLVTDRDNASFTDSILSWHAQHKELVVCDSFVWFLLLVVRI
jgi:hypothetical protein